MRSRRSTAVTIGLAGWSLACLAGCDDPKAPAIAIEGGGFVFNYRIAEVFYGVSVKPMRKLAPGTIIEAELENPAGGPPFVVSETVAGPRLAYALRTPAVSGVKAGRDYRVVVRVKAPGGEVIGEAARSFRSDLDQEVNPEAPLTVGPGYAPNPDAKAPRP